MILGINVTIPAPAVIDHYINTNGAAKLDRTSNSVKEQIILNKIREKA